LIVSEEILDEYERVLNRPKFKLPTWVIQDLLGLIRASALWVAPQRGVESSLRDRSDIKFLEAALGARADLIVSGDKELLDLGIFEGVDIIPPREFLLQL
jgi:putative PIN family toxin of toxin-antitoxin system